MTVERSRPRLRVGFPITGCPDLGGPLPPPRSSQIGVRLSDVHPKASQIGVDLTHSGIDRRRLEARFGFWFG
jgi:hypothetical protein